VTMKNAVFQDVASYRSCVNRCFGGTYRLHLQGRQIRERRTSVSRWLLVPLLPSTLKMEAIRSSETSVHTRSTRRYIPEDGFLVFDLSGLSRDRGSRDCSLLHNVQLGSWDPVGTWDSRTVVELAGHEPHQLSPCSAEVNNM
jgi:hypothetical protein